MRAPPLGELYDLLRAEGFAIGVDDHVRLGRLLARDAAWTPEVLRISIAALVVTDPNERASFDACWERWLQSGEPVRAPDVLPSGEPSRASDVPRSPLGTPKPGSARRVIAVSGAVGIVGAVVVVAVLAGKDWRSPAAPSDAGAAAAGPKAPPSKAGDGPEVPPVKPGEKPEVPPFDAGQGSPFGAPRTYPPPQRPPPPFRTIIDLTWVGLALGAMVLLVIAIGGAVRARARRRFPPGPWRYAPAVPPATNPVLPRIAIEDAAADLAWRAPDPGHELDLARSVALTVERGGLPAFVYRRRVAAPHYLVLEDTANGAYRWSFLYDELLRSLAREGVELERYTFSASPERCAGRNGRVVPLDELLDHVDALIAIGDGDGAVDTLTGDRAAWVASLRHVPRRLWINPVPPVRWSPGAQAISVDTPMEHGAALALAAWSTGGEGPACPEGPYPAVIERAPGTASALAALRTALGERAFRLVAAVAVTGSPAIAAARWLAETHAFGLDEQDWLAVATLPWFRTEKWPEGLRERLSDALVAEDPELARAIVATSERLYAASEPPRDSGAHLAWQLEGAYRAGRRGERAAAASLLHQVVGTPLTYQARGQLAALGLPDRSRRRLAAWGMAGVALVLGGAGSGVVARRLQSAAVAERAAERHLEKLAGEGVRLLVPAGASWPEAFVVRVVDGNGDPVADARIVWSNPQLGARSYLGRSDGAGLSRARQIYASPAREDLQQVAQLISTWKGEGFTDAPVLADGEKVVFGFAQIPASCPEGMVRAAAGTFRMGGPDGVGGEGKHPQHEVTLSAYCLDRTEVTVKAYAACVAAGGCFAAPLMVSWRAEVELYSRFCNREDRPDHPMNCVDWNQATAYCAWAGKRLPSEAEWEYAARGDDGRGYPWGDEPPTEQRLNACGPECVAMAKRVLKKDWTAMETYEASDDWETTAPAGSFPKGVSPIGALDMAGNVWEWTADRYGAYPAAAVTDPPGAETGESRVLRGGGWDSSVAGHVRAANRDSYDASYRFDIVGFRCARGD